MHTFCDGRPYLRVIGTGYLTVHSKFGVPLIFGTGGIVCQGNTAMQGFRTWGEGGLSVIDNYYDRSNKQ